MGLRSARHVPVSRAALVLVAVAVLTACSSGAPEPEPLPDQLDGVEQFGDLSTEHTDEPVEYDQLPPVGGAHLPRWLACDVYDEPVPNEAAVHSMEHGAVWITYDPELPEDEVASLAALTDLDQQYVLVSPFEDLPSAVVASAWGHQLQIDGADDPRLRMFVETFAGGDQGGEPGAPCREGGLTPAEASGAVGT